MGCSIFDEPMSDFAPINDFFLLELENLVDSYFREIVFLSTGTIAFIMAVCVLCKGGIF